MCCAGSLLRFSFFSKLSQNAFVGAIWRGFIMYCKGSRYHGSLTAFQCICLTREIWRKVCFDMWELDHDVVQRARSSFTMSSPSSSAVVGG